MTTEVRSGGPLAGLRFLEFAGLGAAPFCAMMLADHGADVIRIDRLTPNPNAFGAAPETDFVNRSRRSIAIDLKSAEGIAVARALARAANGIIEGFRPGVMERLGLGPEVLLEDNPGLVYGRLTGWGRSGPYASAAGHDINYIALSGGLHGIGHAQSRPVPPLNLVGDYGGGSMMLAFGMLAAVLYARDTGVGQVVDSPMIKGSAVLTTAIHSLMAAGLWSDVRGSNVLDSAAPFYDTYETADGRHVAIGAIEPPFYRILLERLDASADAVLQAQFDRALWPEQRIRLAAIFKSRTRDEWDSILGACDACYAPVLSMTEAPNHPQNIAVGAFVQVEGHSQPAPAPAYSRSPTDTPTPPASGTDTTHGILRQAGYDAVAIARLVKEGIIA
jgi:alpha-methylacyl-CoA racemase